MVMAESSDFNNSGCFEEYSILEETSETVSVAEPSSEPYSEGILTPIENINQLTLTFHIASNSKAVISYYVSAKIKTKMTITVDIDKKILGFWRSTGIKYTDYATGFYASGSHTATIEDSGTYRAVIRVSFNEGKGYAEKQFVFNKNLIYGDADNNGVVTATDARFVLRCATRLEKYDKTLLERCDINGDGMLTASDARYILLIALRIL